MKRILIDVGSIVPSLITGQVSGIGRTTLELVEALEKYNNLPFEVMLYSQNLKGIGSSHFKDKFKKKHFYLPNREFHNKLLAKIPAKEWITNYDLLHLPNNFGYVYDPSKVVITLHDALFMKMQEKQFAHTEMREIVPPLTKKVRGIITCSKSSKADIIETMGVEESKIKVIPWGYNKMIFKPMVTYHLKTKLKNKFKISTPFILSVSCNDERKNTDKLLDAYLTFLKKDPINDLVLVWPNVPSYLKEKVNTHDKFNRVHFLPYVSNEDLAMLYNLSSSLFFISSYEGFGLPILEALGCGCPVVTLRNSSLTEVGGDAVHYLNNLEKESIITSFEMIENNQNLKNENVELRISQASKFDWKNYTELYVEYMNSLL